MNGIFCPDCEQFIFSRFRHDFTSCKCGNTSVDGGLDYLRVGYSGKGNINDVKSVEINSKSLASLTKMTETELELIWNVVKKKESATIYDPFAGTGDIAKLRNLGFDGDITCCEAEVDFIDTTNQVDTWYIRDANIEIDEKFDFIYINPTNGDRKADHADFAYKRWRKTYRDVLGKDLKPYNTGRMNWGPTYRAKISSIYAVLDSMLVVGGEIILSLSHKKQDRAVIEFHTSLLTKLGYKKTGEEVINDDVVYNKDYIKTIVVCRR